MSILTRGLKSPLTCVLLAGGHILLGILEAVLIRRLSLGGSIYYILTLVITVGYGDRTVKNLIAWLPSFMLLYLLGFMLALRRSPEPAIGTTDKEKSVLYHENS